MANRFNLQYLFQLLNGSITERQIKNSALGVCGETFWNEAVIPANASGPDAVTMGIGSLTNPKMVVIIGAQGITYSINSGTEKRNADPIAVESNSQGFSLQANTLVLENSDTQPHTVVVIAVE